MSDGRTASDAPNPAVDDTARVVVTVTEGVPSFSQDSYEFAVPSGSDGSSTPVTVGAVTAVDPEGDAIAYSLRGSDPPRRMYMAGRTANALHTLDSITGEAARVGTAAGFGIGVTAVQGLAWHNGKLHMVGAVGTDTDGIFTVDTDTGVAVRVARLRELGVSAAALTGVASHDGFLYLTAADGTGRLFKADLADGVAVQLGSDDFGAVGESAPTGVASHDGKLYMVGADTDKLYEIDTATGAATAVGAVLGFGVTNDGGGVDGAGGSGGEGEPGDLTSHIGSLYMVGADNDWLYRLDTDSGEATRVGSSEGFGVSEGIPTGIASGYDKPAALTINAADGAVSYTGAAAVVGTEHTPLRSGQRRAVLQRQQLQQRCRRHRRGDGAGHQPSAVVQCRQLLLHPHVRPRRQQRSRSGGHPVGLGPG